MKFLRPILRAYDINLQPSNSHCIGLQAAETLLYPGAHVAAANTHEHFHHGIVINVAPGGIAIVHFWGVRKRDARVQVTTLPLFVAGGPKYLGNRIRRLYIVDYQDDTPEKREATSQRAKEMLSEPDRYKYNIFKLNCESFAYFCRTGRWTSEQVAILGKFLASKGKDIYEEIKHLNSGNVSGCTWPIPVIASGAVTFTEADNLRQWCKAYTLSLM